ncbi:hypothetical protein niasHT_036745 [Heterodera trifolii]|uniref:Brain tumor protein n=1 Tax=Heterodera trifolii TaxID=157864 RepID=A0ABD2IUX3_9BILA
MLWNFEEAISDSSGENSLGTSSSVDTDPLSSMLSSFVRQPSTGGTAAPIGGNDFCADRSSVLLPPHPNDLGLLDQIGTAGSLSGTSAGSMMQHMVKCPLCQLLYKEPKVLACFHSFCKACLERQMAIDTTDLNMPQRIVCQLCSMETQLSPQLGIEGLLSDYGLENAVQSLGSLGTSPYSEQSEDLGFGSLGSGGWPLESVPQCTGCKGGERATAFCRECANYLCANCAQAHRYMNVFEGHSVEELTNPSDALSSPPSFGHPKVRNSTLTACMCLEHRSHPLVLFCQYCQQAICRECMADHQGCEVEAIDNVAEKQIAMMERLLNEARIKQNGLNEIFQMIDMGQSKLNASFQHTKQTIDEACSFLIQTVHEAQKGLYTQLESIYGYKQLQLTMIEKEVQKVTKKMSQTIEFTQRLLKYSSPTEVIVFKPLLDSRLQGFLTFNADSNNLRDACEIRSSSLDLQLARQTIHQMVNQLRSDSWLQSPNGAASVSPPGFADHFTPGKTDFFDSNRTSAAARAFGDGAALDHQLGTFGSFSQMGGAASALATSAPTGTNGFGTIGGMHDNKWTSEMMASLSLNDTELTDLSILMGGDSTAKLSGGGNANKMGGSDGLAASIPMLYPPRSQIKRQKMTYHCKFGEFGVIEGQFTEPSGVAVNAQCDIIVADTNNHRIQVFDREGRFKFQFGECGKRDGQLLYPNRVSVNRVTGDFVVTERSPTHQIQIYNQYGQFIRKFGASILQHPRGVCVDSQGRIVVVECKVMRVLIFDMFGNILHKFSCSRYLEFPNGVCTTDKEEILISDNRAHSIKVFNYEGQFLRQIGGEGVTNYPIGVGINQLGEIVVADNHNNFNLTVFSQDGTLLSAFESKVKHAQCYDVALIDDSVVLASKDYRLYLYKYQQIG